MNASLRMFLVVSGVWRVWNSNPGGEQRWLFRAIACHDVRQANMGELLLEITIFKFKEKFEELW